MNQATQDEVMCALWAFDCMYAADKGWHYPAIIFGILAGLCFKDSVVASIRLYKEWKNDQKGR